MLGASSQRWESGHLTMLRGYGAAIDRSFATSAQQAVDANPTLAAALSQLATRAMAEASAALPTLVAVPIGDIGLLLSVVVVLTMAFFWLTALDALRPFLLELLPEKTQATAHALLDDLGSTLGGYLRGVFANMVIIGMLTSLGLAILDAPYALLLGILAGLTEFIPFLGPWISGSVAVLVALAVGGPIKALEMFLLFQVNHLEEEEHGGAARHEPRGVGGAHRGAIQVVIRTVLAPLARHAASAPPDQTSTPLVVAVVAPATPAVHKPS
jgi:predicted PurR-regulated permease PerM